MALLDCSEDGAAARPVWDGSLLLFAMMDGADSVACGISRAAIEELCDALCHRPADLLRCFAAARVEIEALARAKLRRRPEGLTGRLTLWADDVDLPPSGGAAAESQAAGAGRAG